MLTMLRALCLFLVAVPLHVSMSLTHLFRITVTPWHLDTVPLGHLGVQEHDVTIARGGYVVGNGSDQNRTFLVEDNATLSEKDEDDDDNGPRSRDVLGAG